VSGNGWKETFKNDVDQARRQAAEETSGVHAKNNGRLHPQFKLVRFNDIEPDNTRPYLVKGLIPREGLITVWGPPKCGKTFFVYDLVMHVAMGCDYCGRRVEQATVVYIACEGERGLKARSAAFRKNWLTEDADPPFFLLITRLDLAKEVDTLVLDIAAQIPSGPVGAIVLDTLNRSIGGSENKDEDMSAYVIAATAIADRFRCSVIIIHHCGTNESRPRGHTSLTGAVDAQIAVKRDAKGQIFALVEYMKDGPEDEQVVCRLDVVEVGLDEDGEPITSCVIVPVDGEESKTKPVGKTATLPATAKIALAQLKNALADYGEVPPQCNHIPTNIIAVDYDLWRRCCYSAGISGSDEPEARKKAFSRAAEKLIAVDEVKRWESWVWIP